MLYFFYEKKILTILVIVFSFSIGFVSDANICLSPQTGINLFINDFNYKQQYERASYLLKTYKDQPIFEILKILNIESAKLIKTKESVDI